MLGEVVKVLVNIYWVILMAPFSPIFEASGLGLCT